MRHKIIYFPAAAIFVCFLFFISGKFALAVANTAPTILFAAQIKGVESSQILVNGLISPNYNVKIYLNGKYNGMANISQINTTVNKFSYLSTTTNSNQNFEVMAIGQNKTSLELSVPAIAAVNSVIEQNNFSPAKNNVTPNTSAVFTVNAPTLIRPAGVSCVVAPRISGSAPNNTAVYVYIDNKLSTTINISSSSSLNSPFSYYPTVTLERGSHTVYTIAQDSRGNKSLKSNTLTFCISSPQIITAASTSATEIHNTPTSTLLITAKPTSTAVFQKTINNQFGAKNSLNIIIFLLFVIGLLVWMIFVNRELTNNEKNINQSLK